MKNAILQEIVEFAAQKLKAAYGYCGVATGETAAMLNSDDREGNDIKINISLKSE